MIEPPGNLRVHFHFQLGVTPTLGFAPRTPHRQRGVLTSILRWQYLDEFFYKRSIIPISELASESSDLQSDVILLYQTGSMKPGSSQIIDNSTI